MGKQILFVMASDENMEIPVDQNAMVNFGFPYLALVFIKTGRFFFLENSQVRGWMSCLSQNALDY